MLNRRLILLALVVVPTGALAQESKPAIGGYDTVAYFTQGKPVRGEQSIAHLWDGRRYLFASDQHRQLFIANPDKYAPQFAGNCASGLTGGHKVEADPNNWLISDGRLYLFFAGSDGPAQMRKDPTIAARAEANWQKLK